MKLTRSIMTIAVCVAGAGSAFGQAPPDYTLATGFPVSTQITNWNGGMFVNMDADPELEFVALAGPEIWAINPDGTNCPGFPIFFNSSTFGAPAWGDIDGDGQEEIVFHNFFFGINASILALETDGTVVPGFPIATVGAFKSPSLINLDADPALEIVVMGNFAGTSQMIAYKGNGNVVPGWPYSFPDISAGHTVSAGDIDGDGEVELVGTWFDGGMILLEKDGTPTPGFSWTLPVGQQMSSYAGPTLADLDCDGDLEIIFSTSPFLPQLPGLNPPPEIHAIHHDGSYVAGWPQDYPVPFINDGATGIQAPVAVADIDDDGRLDFVVGDQTLCPDNCTVLMAWDVDGTPKAGFPVDVEGGTQNHITIADIDGDGTMEIFKDTNLAANPPEVYNHDGTLVSGWGFELLDGYGAFEWGDVTGDGDLDFVLGANNITTAVQTNRFFYYESDGRAPFADAAPVPTYMYNYQRTGLYEVPCGPGVTGCNPADLNDAIAGNPLAPTWGIPDGALTPTDFAFFSFAFGTGDLVADINDAGSPNPGFPNFGVPDGILTPADFSAFTIYFGAGCPCTLPGCETGND